VDEVIEKRLLSKKEKHYPLLASVWEKEQASLETLLSFGEIGVQFRKFQDENDFIKKYPFVPYQFDLFQQCIRALSTHNAFQGQHASVGERSMLGVFQYVVQMIEEKEENALVSFDKLFEGIRSTIKGEIQSAITLAEKNLDNEFAIRVLKALFMVKYYDNFKTTERNIKTLMIDHIHVDLNEHDQKVEEALSLLENQTYIRRNGELYEFLTDDEKDIEKEIKEVDLEDQEIKQLFNEIIFDNIIQDNKIRYQDNKHDYEFTRKIDNAFFGKEKELTVEVITPNFQEQDREEFFQGQTMGHNTLMIMVLPQDNRLLQDIHMYLKTQKYVKQNQSTTNKDNVKRILYDKQQQNIERRRTTVLQLKKLLGESEVYLNGTKQDKRATADGKTRVINEFQKLVKLAYPNLKMIGTIQFNEDTIKNAIRSKDYELFGRDDSSISEAETEIFNFVQRRKKQSDKTILANVRDQFSKKPYGWYPFAIWTLIGKLYKRGKLELRQDGNLLDEEGAIEALLNNRHHNNTILEPQIDIDPKMVKELTKVYQEMFDEPCPYKEAKDVGMAFKNKLQEEASKINKLLQNKAQYHFLGDLDPIVEYMEKLGKKDYTYFLNNLQDFEDHLLNYKEDVIDPIRKFWNGEQKKIYDSISKFFTSDQSNLDYIQSDELETLREVYKHPTPYKGNLIQNAKAAKDALEKKMLQMIEEERDQAIEEVNRAIKGIKSKDEFEKLDQKDQQQVLEPFEKQRNKLKELRFIANIRETKNYIKNDLLNKQLNEMLRLSSPKDDGEVGEPKVHYISRSSVRVDIGKSELENEQDVNEYIEALKKEFLKQLKENKRIRI
jgi:predicted transcriptional regulator